VSGVLDGEGEALRFFAAKTPAETVAEINSRLKGVGAPDAAVDRFVANPSSTLTEKLAASAAAARLKGIENAGEAMSHAGEVRNEITSLNRLAAVQRLAAEHECSPIARLRIGPVIAARHRDGGVTALLPGDHTTATAELDELIDEIKNPYDRDVMLKRVLGVPERAFTGALKVIRDPRAPVPPPEKRD
jgi:hypothetical protein